MKRIAMLSVLLFALFQTGAAQRFTQLWRVDAGHPRFPNTGDTYRGGAYNPATDRYLVATRTPATSILVLNPTTGAIVDSLNVGIITGGTLPIVDIEVTSAGVIYASNLVLNTGTDTLFRIYRWENQTAAPTLAFSGRAGAARVGDAFDVAGSGNGTVIYASGNSATSVIQVFTTTDGVNFTLGTPINILAQEAGAGIAQVTAGGNAWVSRFASLNKIDLVNTSGAKIDSIDGSVSGISTGDLHYFTLATRKFLAVAPASAAGGTFGNSEPARLLEVSAGGTAAVFIDSTTRLSANANANASGDVDVKISGTTVTFFVLIGNNGIGAFTITPPPPAVAISNITRSVRAPITNDTVVVTARIVDVSGSGIASDSLLYAINGGTVQKLAMPRISGTNVDGIYRAVIPAGANANGNRVEYQVFARSSSGTTVTTAVSPANSYFAGISPLSLTGVRAMNASRALLYAGYYARVTGTVNSPNFTSLSGRISYMFQDAVGGMNVNRASTTLALNIGDSITVLGVLGQFRGTTQLTPDSLSDIAVVGTGRPLTTTTVSVATYNTNPEAYESRLIRMLSLQRIRSTPAWAGNAAIPVYQYQLGDSTLLFIDADTPLPTATEPTYPTTVTGVGGQFTTSTAVNNDGYEIIPRAITDFAQVHDIGVAGINRTASATDEPMSQRELLRDGSQPTIEVVQSSITPASMANNAPAVFQAIVRNYGDFAENTYQIGWQIDGTGQTAVNNTRPLAAGGRDTISLTWAAPTIGNHTMRAWTILATDENRANDTSATYYFTVVPDNVVFQEGFNNPTFPPIGWTVVDRDTDAAANNWYLAVSSPLPFEGPSYAADNFQSANANRYIDDYLITPNIPGPTVSGDIDSLVFWGKSRFTSPGYPDSLDIRVSTTGRDTANFTIRLRYFRVDTAWTRYAFALPAGATRYIAFRYLLYDGGEIGNSSDKVCVDDVRVIRYSAGPTVGWTAQTSGVTTNLRSVKAVNQNIGWISSNGGNVLRTTNGGTTWTNVGGGAIGTGNVHCITALNENVAIIGSSPADTAWILRTTNGGATWARVFTQVGGFIDAVHMFDANNGVALGDPVGGKWTVARTTDGGATWTRMATEPTQVGTEAGWNNAFQALTNSVWVFGTDNTKIYKTTDAGLTWTSAATTAVSSYSVWMNDATYGVAGFGGGVVNRTVNGGAAWNAVTVPGTATNNVAGATGAGVDFWLTRGNLVHRSTDRGATWTTDYTSTVGATLNYLNFWRSGSTVAGWAVSSTGGIARYFGTITGIKEETGIPEAFTLQQNYPNPFNPSTTIRYALPEAARVNLSVYNVLGQRVAELTNQVESAGFYTQVWDGRNSNGTQVATGVYFYRIEAQPTSGGAPFVSLKKMMFVK